MNIIHRLQHEQPDGQSVVEMETRVDGSYVYIETKSDTRLRETVMCFDPVELDEYIEHLQKCRKAMR